MALYKGTGCGDLTYIACNGDGEGSSGPCGSLYYSRIPGISAATGDVFYVRIGGYQGTAGASGLLVTFTPATFPACATSTGACGEAHGGVGCADVACCEVVCGANPFCCELEWDSDCIEIAADVALCGVFLHRCEDGGPANDCATSAELVQASGSRQFSLTGADMDGPNHPGSQCGNSGNEFIYRDLWYRVPVIANGNLVVKTCNAVNFDSKIAVYDMGTQPGSYDYDTLPTSLVGCNDDGPDACAGTVFASELSVAVQTGRSYLVRVGNFADAGGSGTVTFEVPTPCQLPPPTKTEAEACGSATNQGCLTAAAASEEISLGDVVRGTFYADAGVRDNDYYRLTLSSETKVTATVRSASFAGLLIVRGDLSVVNCGGMVTVAATFGSCPGQYEACLPAGTYYLIVRPTTATGTPVTSGLPCGSGVFNEYSLSVTGVAASGECVANTAGCAEAGPDTQWLSAFQSLTNPVNVVYGCFFVGGGPQNWFAIKVPQANQLSEITCVRLGVSVGRYLASAGVIVASPVTIPARLSFYRDTDGGDPTEFSVTAGDGNDLELIESYDILCTGGAYVGSVTLPEPLCLTGESNVLMVLESPELFVGSTTSTPPSGEGYGVGVAVRVDPSLAGQGNLWFRSSQGNPCFDVFTAVGNGPTNPYQWVVAINGTAASCGSGGGCRADLDNPPDGVVGGTDLAALLAAWGTNSPDVELDTPPNNVISGTDLAVLLAAWGPCAP